MRVRAHNGGLLKRGKSSVACKAGRTPYVVSEVSLQYNILFSKKLLGKVLFHPVQEQKESENPLQWLRQLESTTSVVFTYRD